jgi:hypothetical protein
MRADVQPMIRYRLLARVSLLPVIFKNAPIAAAIHTVISSGIPIVRGGTRRLTGVIVATISRYMAAWSARFMMRWARGVRANT